MLLLISYLSIFFYQKHFVTVLEWELCVLGHMENNSSGWTESRYDFCLLCEASGLELNSPEGLLWFMCLSVICCSALSAYSHFREVIFWESVPTKQYRSRKGGVMPCCWLAILASAWSPLYLMICAYIIVMTLDILHLWWYMEFLHSSATTCAVWEVYEQLCSFCVTLQW